MEIHTIIAYLKISVESISVHKFFYIIKYIYIHTHKVVLNYLVT